MVRLLVKLLGTNLVVFLITTKNVTVEQNMTMAVSLLKISIVCGDTTEPELNPSLTKLVTKVVSTKMSEGYGKATDVLYWLSIVYKPPYPLLLLF